MDQLWHPTFRLMGNAGSCRSICRMDDDQPVRRRGGHGIDPKLEKGVFNLINGPERFSLFELKHGIGTIDAMLEFYSGLLKECREYPFAELCCRVID